MYNRKVIYLFTRTTTIDYYQRDSCFYFHLNNKHETKFLIISYMKTSSMHIKLIATEIDL